ncbi:MAG TPA: hypothetical protein VKS22_14285 [Candidatus Binataceae bacterium]|nr:hypothetical protein [Candidatus Binataceae bacterium]
MLAALALTLGGCAVADAPIKDMPKVVAAPQAGQLAVTSQPGATIGAVQPVYVSIANGSDAPLSVVPSQIFALDEGGNRIAPLPAAEAARQAGGAGDLKAALTSAATSGLILGAVGTGVGAVAGSLLGSGAVGAGVGGAIGAAEGGLEGAAAGPQKAEQQANTQLNALALQPSSVAHDFTVSGYVFFPKGNYRQLQMVLVDGESGDTQIINRPW